MCIRDRNIIASSLVALITLITIFSFFSLVDQLDDAGHGNYGVFQAIEYVLLKDINDSDEDAQRLANWLKGIPCKINLIPFNSFDSAGYRPPSERQTFKFQDYLIGQNFSAFIRQNRATDILGACGQLAAQSKNLSFV